MTTRFTLNLPQPRNPLVALARGRRAGVHRASPGAQRQSRRRDTAGQVAQALAHERHRSP
jgi:hypothetical protein